MILFSRALLVATLSLSYWFGEAQTLGLITYDQNATPGYTLLSPVAGHSTYLIDECGRLINQWDSDRPPAQSAYLMPDGRLWRTGKVSGSFFSGGVGGSVQVFDWEGNLEWDFRYASEEHQAHHDIEPLLNGNVLLIAWDNMPMDTAIANGRNPNWVTERGLWPDKIVEIKPTTFDQGEVIWEWKSRDHLIQDFDSSKSNFGDVAKHPELIDFNFARLNDPPLAIPDWIHSNSIDYNPVLDQVLLSSRKFNEIWIIDHSTTTEEAASHTGGKYGKGGDLLYRWGNSRAYQRGTLADQQLFGQHDAHWISDELPLAGHIIIYNNGFERPGDEYSSIDIINPPTDQNGNYIIPLTGALGPDVLTRTWRGNGSVPFGSGRMSGVEMLPNGNLLICNADLGRIIEISINNTLLWEYVSPILGRNPGQQGSTPTQNNLFHAPRYSHDYPGFEGRILEPGDPIELNPSHLLCNVTPVVNLSDDEWLVLLNAVDDVLQVFNQSESVVKLIVVDLQGRQWQRATCPPGSTDVSMRSAFPGVYIAYIIVKDRSEQRTYVQRFLKN